MTVVSTVFVGSAQGSAQLLAEAVGRRLRNQLRALGVVVLDAAATRRGGGTLAEALVDERAVVGAVAGAVRAVLILEETVLEETLLEEVGAHSTAALRVADIAAVCGEPALQVVLTVERQDRLIEHRRVDALRVGRPDLAGDGRTDVRYDGGVRYDHAVDVRALDALPAVSQVLVRPYELVQAGTAAFVDDALALAGLRGRLDLRAIRGPFDELVAYRTYSPTAVALSRALDDGGATPAEREVVHDFLLTDFPGDERTRLLDESARQEVVDAHRDLNAAFFARWVPDLPPDSYADDAATARLADVLVAPRIPPPGPVAISRTVRARAQRDLRRWLDRGE